MLNIKKWLGVNMKNNLIGLIIITTSLAGGIALGHVWGWIGIAASDYKDISRIPVWIRNY